MSLIPTSTGSAAAIADVIPGMGALTTLDINRNFIATGCIELAI